MYELGLSYSAVGTNRGAINAIPEIPGVPKLGKHWLLSLFMRPEIYTTKAHQNNDCQQDIALSEKFWTKWLIQFEANDMKTPALLTISAGHQIQALHMLNVIHIDQSNGKVIFHIIKLVKCSKQSRPNQPVVYMEYPENDLLCLAKCM